MRNIKQPPQPQARHEIVDTGIYDLLKTEDHRYTEKRLSDWQKLETSGWKVVPDCPDLAGEFKIECDIDNVEYSMELLEEYFDPHNEHHLPVIQAYFLNIPSYKYFIEKFIEKYGRHNKIAIGSVCKADHKETVVATMKYARRKFPKTWIHGFGLRLHHFSGVYNFLDSFDTMAWTFPRHSYTKAYANGEEYRGMEEEYFRRYIKRVNEIIGPAYHQEQGVLSF